MKAARARPLEKSKKVNKLELKNNSGRFFNSHTQPSNAFVFIIWYTVAKTQNSSMIKRCNQEIIIVYSYIKIHFSVFLI